MRVPAAIALLSFTVGTCGVISPAFAQSTPEKPSIELSRCRVQLKDRVALAGERVGILAFVPEEGQEFRADESIVRLHDDTAQAELEIARRQASNDVQVRYAVKAAELADAEYNKALEANRQFSGTVPDVEVRRLKLAYERGVLQIEQARHELEIAKLRVQAAEAQLKTYRVKAPFDGVVTRVLKQKGEAVRLGDPIVELVNDKQVRVEGYVSAAESEKIKAGDPVRVRLAEAPGGQGLRVRAFEGRVAFVDVTVQPVTGEVRVWANVGDPSRTLKAGYVAHMTVDPAQSASERVAATMK